MVASRRVAVLEVHVGLVVAYDDDDSFEGPADRKGCVNQNEVIVDRILEDLYLAACGVARTAYLWARVVSVD